MKPPNSPRKLGSNKGAKRAEPDDCFNVQRPVPFRRRFNPDAEPLDPRAGGPVCKPFFGGRNSKLSGGFFPSATLAALIGAVNFFCGCAPCPRMVWRSRLFSCCRGSANFDDWVFVLVIAMFGLACGTPLTFNEFSRDFVPLWRGLLSSRWEVCEALAGIRTRTVTQ